MADRKAELERKKAKLAAMREEKRRKEIAKKEGFSPQVDVPTGGGDKPDLRGQAEEILRDIGIDPHATAAQQKTSVSPTNTGDTKQPIVQPQQVRRRRVELSSSKVTQTNIPPKEIVTYNKEIQTHIEQHEREDDDADSMDATMETHPVHAHRMPKPEMMKPAETVEDHVTPIKEEQPQLPDLSEDEKLEIMTRDDFHKFLNKTIRLVERAVHEDDIFVDYTGETDEENDRGLAEGERLKLNKQFFDERWTKHRIVTCLDWSAQHPELLAASYNNNEDSPHDPDGVALIWNLKFKNQSPEYIFHCQSAVMSTCFAKFHPNLLVGGTYSGQMVLWDNRSNKRTPVQRTPLSASAHTHPVYCVQVVGTQNAYNLISVSTDGKMCSWSLDMLSQPQDAIELQRSNKPVAVTSLSFMPGDVNNFVVGSEEGAVYTACRHGSKAGVSEVFEGHKGPVTGIHANSVPGAIDFSQYFLSSSFDWTVKLWNAKENRPLHSFEDFADYVYDTKWSPIHPALFATVDGMGRLDIWNLNNDIEVPTASTYSESNAALNKCLWHSSGHHIAVADDFGRVSIYDVNESLANPRADEWTRFVHTLQEMKQDLTDQDEDRRLMSFV